MYFGGGYEIIKVLMRHYLWNRNLPALLFVHEHSVCTKVFTEHSECKSKNPPISLLANQNAFCPGQFFRISKNPSTSVLGTEFVFCPALFSKFPEYKNSPYFFIRNKNAVLDGKFFNEFSNYCASAKILPLYIRFQPFCRGVFRPTLSLFYKVLSAQKVLLLLY